MEEEREEEVEEKKQPTSEVWMCGCIIYKEEDSYFISGDANGFPGALTAACPPWTGGISEIEAAL